MSDQNKTQLLLNAAAALPTVLANRFLIFGGDSGVRVAFGEQPHSSGPTTYHQAVMMSAENWRQLTELLAPMLAKAGKPIPPAAGGLH